MSLASLLSAYITLNVLILFSYLLLKVIWQFKLPLKKSASEGLKLHYVLLASVFIVTLAQSFLVKPHIFRPTVKVWSSKSMKTFSNDYIAPNKGGYLAIPTLRGDSIIEGDFVSNLFLLFFLAALCSGMIGLWRDFALLRKIRSHSFLIKSYRHIGIFVSDEVSVPLSYWIPGHADVIIPNFLMSRPKEFRMVILHELQHHRQKDTKWIHAIRFLRTICPMNPFIHLWNRWLSEIQEFACDETLVDQEKVESQQYARCLIEVAETALYRKHAPACATGLIFRIERNLLKRRITTMLKQKHLKGRPHPIASLQRMHKKWLKLRKPTQAFLSL